MLFEGYIPSRHDLMSLLGYDQKRLNEIYIKGEYFRQTLVRGHGRIIKDIIKHLDKLEQLFDEKRRDFVSFCETKIEFSKSAINQFINKQSGSLEKLIEHTLRYYTVLSELYDKTEGPANNGKKYKENRVRSFTNQYVETLYSNDIYRTSYYLYIDYLLDENQDIEDIKNRLKIIASVENFKLLKEHCKGQLIGIEIDDDLENPSMTNSSNDFEGEQEDFSDQISLQDISKGYNKESSSISDDLIDPFIQNSQYSFDDIENYLDQIDD